MKREPNHAVVWMTLLLAAAIHGESNAQIGGKPAPARPKSAPSSLDKLDPWKKANPSDRDRQAGEDDRDMTPLATDSLVVITLGQRVKGKFEKRGDAGLIRFRAPAATRLRFSMACAGGVGTSNVALLHPDGTVFEAFERDGRRFELKDLELMRSGVYSVRIVHDDELPMSFVMSTEGEYAKSFERTVELSTEKAELLTFEGFEGRSIVGAAVIPLAPREAIDVRLVITDNFDEKLGSFEGVKRSAGDPNLEVKSPIEVSDLDIFRCDLWLIAGRSPQKVKLRLDFQNPPPGVGTVELKKRS